MALTPSRLFVSSFYGLDQSTETPNLFSVNLSQSLTRVKTSELTSLTLTFLPVSPNIPPEEAELDLKVNTVQVGGTLDTTLVYNNPSDLVTELNAVSSSGTFTYNPATARITYTAPNPADTIVFTYSTNNILRRLGGDINQTPTTTITATGSYTFPNPPIIIRTTCLFIASQTMTTDAIIGGYGGRQDIVAQIPMESGVYGDIVNYELANDIEKTDTYNSNINVIKFEVLDDQFNALPLCRNATINAVFSLQYHEDQNLTARLRY